MGKENISFLIVWIILGNIFVTFSSVPEATESSSIVFGKTQQTLHSLMLLFCFSFLFFFFPWVEL